MFPATLPWELMYINKYISVIIYIITIMFMFIIILFYFVIFICIHTW